MFNPNALYNDTITGRKFVRIKAKLTDGQIASLIEDGHKMLRNPRLLATLKDLAEQWITLDHTAVEITTSQYRNMDQLIEVDSHGNPV